MTDAPTADGERRDELLAGICAAAATLGTAITVLSPHGGDAEPIVITPSPPTPEEQDTALAALTGTAGERKPVTELDRNMLRLRLARDAKMAGVPWAAIGRALGGISGKAAKAEMKRLARVTQRQLLAQRDG